jgi:hypothetical protein
MKSVLCKAVLCKHNDSHTRGDVGECQMSNIILNVSIDNRIECMCYEPLDGCECGGDCSCQK